VSSRATHDQLREQLLTALRDAGRAHSEATVVWHAGIADAVGIHPTDYKTMSLLQRQGPMSAGAIADTTGLTTASVTALINRLERRHFVRRAHDPADGRRVIVEITSEGVDTFAPFFQAPELAQHRLFAPYTTDELQVIHDFLRRSTERLRSATSRLAADPSTSQDTAK
jgi:DNA-binding MarR family transcriptional regulator